MGWYERLETRREREGLSMRALATRLGLGSPQTIYNWRLGHNRPSRSTVEALARYLGESPGDLAVEMSQAVGLGQDELVAAVTARRLNAQWHRTHLHDIRSLLGPPGPHGGPLEPEGIDLVLPLLRQRLPDCMISVLLSRRGHRIRIPYEYLVHVERDPTEPAHGPPGDEELHHRVQRALTGLRGPVWWERSADLLPGTWDRAGVTFIYPRLLESRPPDWLEPRYEHRQGLVDIFVLSVYHGGAPDVGALLAPCLGFGYSTITNLAAQLGSWTMNALRTGTQMGAQTDLARALTATRSPIAGPFVWSINDPQPVLDGVVSDNLVRHFLGLVVLLELSPEALEYAAWQVAQVETLPAAPAATRVREYREMLSEQQAGLGAIVTAMDGVHAPASRTVRIPIRLPGQAGKRDDGGYPDAEDAFFDLWAAAAVKARTWLDRFGKDGQAAPSPERVRQVIRPDDLLGPLVHARRGRAAPRQDGRRAPRAAWS